MWPYWESQRREQRTWLWKRRVYWTSPGMYAPQQTTCDAYGPNAGPDDPLWREWYRRHTFGWRRKAPKFYYPEDDIRYTWRL